MYGVGYNFDLVFPKVFNVEIELGFHLFDYFCRHVDAIRVRQAFDTRGNIDAIPVNVVLIHYEVADVETDPVSHLRVLRYVLIVDPDIVLHVHGTLHSLNGTCKIDEQSVTHQFYDAPIMCGHDRFEKPFAMAFDYSESTRLVLSYKAAVADYI